MTNKQRQNQRFITESQQIDEIRDWAATYGPHGGYIHIDSDNMLAICERHVSDDGIEQVRRAPDPVDYHSVSFLYAMLRGGLLQNHII